MYFLFHQTYGGSKLPIQMVPATAKVTGIPKVFHRNFKCPGGRTGKVAGAGWRSDSATEILSPFEKCIFAIIY